MTVNRTVYGGAIVALLGLLAGLLLAAVVGTRGVEAQDVQPKAAGTNGPEEVYALNRKDQLLRFDGDRPENIQRRITVKGLGRGTLVGVDYRPANGRLYGLGKGGSVYRISTADGQATRTARLQTAGGRRITPQGDSFGIDFNPTVDRLRVVSDADQNLRVNVDTGETTVDPDIRYRGGGTDPRAVGVAYENNRRGAFGGSTQIFYIEAARDNLATAGNPDSGVISGVGDLGIAANIIAGFDIVTRDRNNAAYAALQDGPFESSFYNVDRSSGQARRIGEIGESSNILGIAIPIGQR